MVFLKVRKISIEVIPHGEPYILVTTNKIIEDDKGTVIKIIKDFDQICYKLSDIPPIPVRGVSDAGVIDPMEIHAMLSTICYSWLLEKHGGIMEGTRLVIS